MTTVTTSDAGTASSDTIARGRLIVSIMISTPMTVRIEVMSWVSVCCSDWPMLSMSLVTRLRMSPRGCSSK